MDDVYPNRVQLKVDLGKQLLKAHIFILFYFFNIMKLIIFFFSPRPDGITKHSRVKENF